MDDSVGDYGPMTGRSHKSDNASTP